LPHSFAKEVVRLTDVSETTFAPFGRLINDFTMHNEEPGEACWPGVEAAYREGMAGTLCQEFMVSIEMRTFQFWGNNTRMEKVIKILLISFDRELNFLQNIKNSEFLKNYTKS